MTLPRSASLISCVLAAFALLGEFAFADAPTSPQSQFDRNYTFLYFENGYPTRLARYRRPQADANTAARENPDIVVQTGRYSLKLDCDDMRLTGYDALAGTNYVAALSQDVAVFTPADLHLSIEKDGVAYRCTSAVVQDKDDQYVRLIESGQYVQRFDHLGLVFTSESGETLKKVGRFEVAAWPDHAVFTLDLSGVPGVTKTSIRLTSPVGKTFSSTQEGAVARIDVQPHLDREYTPPDVSSHLVEASFKRDGVALRAELDADEHGLRVDLPIERVTFPKDKDRVDEFVLEVANPFDAPLNLPLILRELRPAAITGTCMILCDDRDGRPTGIPVQISKNWHRDANKPTVHEGPWLRGYTMIPLAPRERRRLRLRVVYGFWGEAAAVSYSQLSVIGYGGNWKWDESALGCWGESMTYDPTQHLGAAFIDDVRPAFTTNKSGQGAYNWTENVGGGDFLVYHDGENRYHWAKRLKTAYRCTGPNMTEVLYSGVTDDDRIRFFYRVRSVRANDYHRRFHAWCYDFLDDVESPRRLVFHRMAAEYYKTVDFDRYFVGDENGLRDSHDRPRDGGGYSDDALPFDGSWLAIDDVSCNDRERTTARRGLLSLSSTLNGAPLPLHMHPFGATWGQHTTLFDLSSESPQRSYSKGDRVTGELAFVLPPKSSDDYWGPDQAFAERLEAAADNPWRLIADEYASNARMDVTVHAGTLNGNYPLDIRAASSTDGLLVDCTITRGGVGHVPIIVRGVPLGVALRAEEQVDGAWRPIAGADLARHDYYQAVRDTNGTLDCVFNAIRPTADLDAAWRIRISTSE